MSKLVVLIGLQGSGKSTFAKQWVAEAPNRYRLNYDELRTELFGPNWVWNRKEEDLMKAIGRDRVGHALAVGQDAIIDNTNLSEKVRAGWRSFAEAHNATYDELPFIVPIEECIKRDAARDGAARVGRAVIERTALFNGLLRFDDRTSYSRDFIIVDMDGTLADCSHRRIKAAKPLKHRLVGVTPSAAPSMTCPNIGFEFGPQDTCPACLAKPKLNWGIFYEGIADDPVIEPIRNLLWETSYTLGDDEGSYIERDIIVVSGRPSDKAGKDTEDWLLKHRIHAKHLFMRQGGDSRPDYEVKEEILDKMVQCGMDLARIKYVIDDRDQVVKMWRKRGLTCLQVAEGDF